MSNAVDRQLWKWALASWAAPLVAGLAIALAYIATGNPALQLAGGGVILVGSLLAAVGIVLSIVDARSASPAPPTPWRPPALAVAALLLSNFPVALGLFAVTEHLDETLTLVVDNRSGTVVEDITIVAPEQRFKMASVPAGERQTARFHLAGEGEVSYSLRSGSTERKGTALGYITGGMRMGSVTLQIEPTGNVLVVPGQVAE